MYAAASEPAALAAMASLGASFYDPAFFEDGLLWREAPCQPDRPLLFYRGRYTVTDPGAAAGPPEVVDALLPRRADWI